jgi:hypothetical protein
MGIPEILKPQFERMWSFERLVTSLAIEETIHDGGNERRSNGEGKRDGA